VTLRIAMVSPRFHPFIGGVETHVRELAMRYVALGHSVDVLTYTHDPALPRVEAVGGIVVRRFLVPVGGRHYAVAPGLFRFLRKAADRFDVVHAHGYHSTAALLAHAAGARPFVLTPHFHGTGHSAVRAALHVPYRWLAGRRLVHGANRIICVSNAEASLLRDRFGLADDRVTVISNGIDVERIRSADPFPERRPVVLCVGRLESYKGIDRTLAAFDLLDDDCLLRVIGTGPDAARLSAVAARLRRRADVAFLPSVDVDELHRWYRTATVYVTMSMHEAQSIGTLEAAAAGAAVVATDIPAHREIAATTVPQLTLVPVDAGPAQLAAAIRRAAPSEATAVPTWDDAARATLALYADVTRDTVTPSRRRR
jgi:glycosyltransferase involved in cell wall biosynthesis